MKVSYKMARDVKPLASLYLEYKYCFLDRSYVIKNLDNFCLDIKQYVIQVPYSFYCRSRFKWGTGMAHACLKNFEKMANFCLNDEKYKLADKNILRATLNKVREDVIDTEQTQ